MHASRRIPTDIAFRNARIYPIPVTQLTRIPPTSDANRFYRFDAIKVAEDVGTMPTSGFRPYSRNVKAPCNGRKAAKAGLGVTGGHVAGADAEDWNTPIPATPTGQRMDASDAPKSGHGSGKRRKRGKDARTQSARYYR